MADKKKLQKISAELKKASQMHAAQAKKIDNMSKGPSMINLAAAIGLGGKQKDPNKDTAVGNVPPHSHDNSKNNNTMNPIGNITGNLNNNLKVQELGANLFQGEALAEQEMAKRNLGKPVMPPSPDPMGDQYGMQFNQPFAQTETVHPVPQQPPMRPPRVPQVPTKPTTKIYKEMTEQIPKEMTGLQSEQRIHRHEEKMEKFIKPTEMPRRINMMGSIKKAKDPKSKYRVPTEGVSGLQDLGAVKSDKKGQYVVNRNPESVRDTLRFPKGTTHYSGNPYKVGQTIDETDFEEIVNKVNKS